MCEMIDFKFFDSIFEADKREVQTKIDNNQIIPQFQILKKNPCFSELFIVSNDNIDIYKETLIRRIKTRETWKKNPNQIIQEKYLLSKLSFVSIYLAKILCYLHVKFCYSTLKIIGV